MAKRELVAELESRLARLGAVKAPSGLVAAVMERVEPDCWAEMDSIFGSICVAFRRGTVTAVMLAREDVDFEAHYREEVRRDVRRVGEVPPQLAAGLARAFEKGRPGPAVDIGWMTPFEQAVLRKTSEIPLGEVRTYGWVAREIGRPRAVRAVGTALGHNPIPLLIPCHRVVRSDATIGQYSGGGPEAKRRILKVEGVDADELEALARRGIRYVGSDTTHVYCYPTCSDAKRITDAHRVEFRSEGHAERAGYRACLRCRPGGELAA